MTENAVGFFTGYAQVQHPEYWGEKILENSLDAEGAITNKLEAHPNVAQVLPRINSFALAAADEKTKGVLITGVDREKEKHVIDLESKISKGEYFFKDNSSVLVSSGLAEYLELGVADTLVLLGSGYQGASAAGKYPVSGLVSFGSPDLNNNMVFMPLALSQQFYGMEGKVTSYVLKFHNERNLTSSVSELSGDGFRVMHWKEMLPELIQLIEADSAGGLVMLAILYLITGFGMFGTVLMMTNERIYEFGLLLAIGMRRWKLLVVFLIESFLLALLGVIAGVIVSIPILTYFYYNPIHLASDMKDFTEKFDIEPVLNFSLDPSIFLSQALYVFGMALIINAYPIWRILRLKPVEAMRV